MEPETYLGDALYASFDGFHIVLRTSDGVRTTNAISLDPEVFRALVGYEQRLRTGYRKAQQEGTV